MSDLLCDHKEIIPRDYFPSKKNDILSAHCVHTLILSYGRKLLQHPALVEVYYLWMCHPGLTGFLYY